MDERRKRFFTSVVAVTLLLSAFCPVNSYSGEDSEYLHLNKVIAKLEEGKLVTGIWCLSQSMANARNLVSYNGFPTQTEAMNRPMIDFILVAMEHYPFNISRLREFTLGLTSRREIMTKGNLQPSFATFVRLPVEGGDPVHAMIKQALDVGVHGVVIPHVRNAAEARKIVEACRFARPSDSPYREPLGTRGFSPAICSYLWGLTPAEYYQRADTWPLNPNGDLMVIVMVEDPEGVQNINEIAAVPGIGAIFFGPADYTVSSGNYRRKDFDVNEALNTVKKACDTAGVPFVGFASIDNIAEKSREKNRMYIIGSDVDNSGRAEKVLDYLRTR